MFGPSTNDSRFSIHRTDKNFWFRYFQQTPLVFRSRQRKRPRW